MKGKCLKSSPSFHEAISHQLEHMLANPDFKATPHQAALLKYVVKQTLADNADRIKGYTVATEVFGRSADFDQSIDPIVSIQAARLRQALARYYENGGKNDPVRIDIPKGTYVPTFKAQRLNDAPIAAEQVDVVDFMQTWPSLLVRPLANLTANPEDDYLAIGLTAELAHALSRYREIRILEARHSEPESTHRESDIDFIIDGNVRRDLTGIKVTITLYDANKGIQIWSHKYLGDLQAAKMISFQEDVAEEIAVHVAGDNAIITRHLADLFRETVPPALKTYEAMLRFWECDTLHNPQSYAHAIRVLENAVALEPECEQVWSMLARLYLDNYGNEIVDLPTPLQKAAAYAQKGVSLDPTNRRARTILAYVRLMQNRLAEARYEAETAYNLCPDSLMVLDSIGWVMALAGDWQRGVDWINKAVALNPYFRPWARHALCLNWFRLGNYEKAYRESFDFMMPKCHWDQFLKASACGHLGKIEEGRANVRALLALKPDFPQRGRILMGRYVKFEDIADRIIKGLDAVGLALC